MKRLSKINILFLCFIIISILGCGKQELNTSNYRTMGANYISFRPDKSTEMVYDMAIGEKRYIFLERDLIKDSGFLLFQMDPNTKNITKVDYSIPKSSVVYHLSLDSSDNLYILSKDNDLQKYYIDILDYDNKYMNTVDISEYAQNFLEKQESIRVEVDQNGCIYLIGFFHLAIINQNGTSLYQGELKNAFWTYFKDSNNQMHILKYGHKKIAEEYLFDTSSYQLKPKGNVSILGREIMNGADLYEYFYQTRDMENGLDKEIIGIKDGREYILTNTSDWGLVSDNICEILATNDGTFFCLYTEISGEQHVYWINEIEKTISNKKEIEIVGIGIDLKFQNAVSLFNSSQNEIHMNLTDLIKQYDSEDEAYRQLQLRLISSDNIDLVIVNNNFYSELVEKGLLYDLVAFWEQSSAIREEEFVDSWFQSLLNEKGEMYWIAPEFYLKIGMHKGKDGIISDDFLISENQNRFANDELFYVASDKEELLMEMIRYNPNGLVDYSNKQCNFDGDYFKNILQHIDDINIESNKGCTMPEVVRKGNAKIVLQDVDSLLYYMLYEEMYEGDIGYLYLPTAKGYHPVLEFPIGEIAISSKSENKEICWEFIEYILSEDSYQKVFGSEYFPVRKDALNLAIERMSATENYTKADGTYIDKVDGTYEVGYDDYTISPRALSDDQRERFNRILDNAVFCDSMNRDLLNIVLSECSKYFSHEQGLDQTIEFLQKRGDIYLNEKGI